VVGAAESTEFEVDACAEDKDVDELAPVASDEKKEENLSLNSCRLLGDHTLVDAEEETTNKFSNRNFHSELE
jgi:hypothetical protein